MPGRRTPSSTRAAARATAAAASLIAVAAAAVALTGCAPVAGSFSAAERWLAAQQSVVAVSEVASYTDGFTRKGTLHAELDPAATDAEVEQLAHDIAVFLDGGSRDNVIVRVGRDGADFVVPGPADSEFSARLWQATVGTPGLVDALVTNDPESGEPAIHVGALRRDAVDVATAVAESVGQRFGGSDDSAELLVQVAGYADSSRLIEDADLAARSASVDRNIVFIDVPWAVSVTTTPGCSPDPAVLAQVNSFVADNAIASGHFALCDSLVARYSDFRSLAAEAPKLRSTLDAAGLSDFPVTIESSPELTYDSIDLPSRAVQVSPGDPATFAVLAALEAPAIAPTISYRLAAGRLDVTDPGPDALSLEELLEVVEASGAAELLTELSLSSAGQTVVSAPSTIRDHIS